VFVCLFFCLFVSVCHYLSINSLSVCLYVCLSVFVYVRLSLSLFFICLCVCVCLCLCFFVCVCLSVIHSFGQLVSQSLSQSLGQSACLPIFPSVRLSVSVSNFVFQICLYAVCLSLSVSVILSVCTFVHLLPACLSIDLLVSSSVLPSFFLYPNLSVRNSMCVSARLSVCQSKFQTFSALSKLERLSPTDYS
jgi:hypothetical protein